MGGDAQYGQEGQPGVNPDQGPQDAIPWQQPGQAPAAGPQWQQPYQQQPGYPQPQWQGGQPPNHPQAPVPGQYWPGMQPVPPPRTSGAKVAIFAAVGVVVVIGVVAALVLVGRSSNSTPAAVASAQASSVSASTPPDTATSSTGYEASGTAAVQGIGVPTYNAADAMKDYTVTFHTNRGNIVVDMNGSAAPYTVYSFVYLADKSYFNATKCHRLTTSEIYVLQCGDPSGTGSGGPGYTIPDENLTSLGTPNAGGTVTYKAGVVAMANTGQPHSGGSQFFIVYQDTPLPPTYTPFGTVTQGLSIIQQVASAGTNNANGSGDGAPNDPVQIETVTVSAR